MYSHSTQQTNIDETGIFGDFGSILLAKHLPLYLPRKGLSSRLFRLGYLSTDDGSLLEDNSSFEHRKTKKRFVTLPKFYLEDFDKAPLNSRA